MKSVRSTIKANKKIITNTKRATRNVNDAAKLASARCRVVSARVNIVKVGMFDVTNIDHAELARIVPEKVFAFGESTVMAARQTLRTAAKVGNYAMNEWLAMNRAVLSIAAARSPLAVGLAQSSGTYAWWARMVTHSAEIATMMTQSQKTVSEPIRRAAHANATRLSP